MADDSFTPADLTEPCRISANDIALSGCRPPLLLVTRQARRSRTMGISICIVMKTCGKLDRMLSLIPEFSLCWQAKPADGGGAE